MNLRPIKACHDCGRSYTIAQWTLLQRLTHQPDPVPEGCEARVCVCGSTLVLDMRGVETIVDALPDEHTASREEPPPAALAYGDPHDCPRSWGYRMEAATVFFAHVPLVPYPRPIKPRQNAQHRAEASLQELIAARAVLEMLIATCAAQAHDQPEADPAPEPKDAKP